MLIFKALNAAVEKATWEDSEVKPAVKKLLELFEDDTENVGYELDPKFDVLSNDLIELLSEEEEVSVLVDENEDEKEDEMEEEIDEEMEDNEEDDEDEDETSSEIDDEDEEEEEEDFVDEALEEEEEEEEEDFDEDDEDDPDES